MTCGGVNEISRLIEPSEVRVFQREKVLYTVCTFQKDRTREVHFCVPRLAYVYVCPFRRVYVYVSTVTYGTCNFS